MATYPHYRSFRRNVLTAAAVCLIIAGLCHALLTYSDQAYAQPTATKTVVLKKIATKQVPSTGLASAMQSATINNAQVVATPACQPNNSYSLPGAIDLTTAPAGVTYNSDSPAYYQVYGTSATTIGTQLTKCAPQFSGSVRGGHYLAYTSYNLSWQYDTSVEADGTCSAANVKIGQHSSQIFPHWNSAMVASPQLRQQWSSFIANLQTHENGHMLLDQQYAYRALQDIQALQHVDCKVIAATISTTLQRDIAALNTAHMQHDTQTGYGASEGAIWFTN